MRAIKLKKPAGLDQFDIRDMELSQVRRGEIRVRLHASSLNFHDYYVVMGMFPTEAGRIPMSDGAGEVVETGEDVTEFAPGDRVMSTFFRAGWQECRTQSASLRSLGITGHCLLGARRRSTPQRVIRRRCARFAKNGS